MPFHALVHDALWGEADEAAHAELKRAMKALAGLSAPTRSSNVRPLEGSAYPKSYRLRVGWHRVIFLLLPHEKTLVSTTAFVKRRESDYTAATKRHDARVRAYE